MLGFLLIVIMPLVALNVWATRRVAAADDALGLPKRMLIAGIWIIPFIGALIAKSHAPSGSHGRSEMPDARSGAGWLEAPEAITASSGDDFRIADHLQHIQGVPVLDWTALTEWARQGETPEAVSEATDRGRRAWLLHLRDALGPDAWLHAASDAYVLSTLDQPIVEAASDYVSRARRRISGVLGDLARFPAGERSILLVFDSAEDYYHYVSIYYPSEGEFAFSGGMFIDAGCPHFVLVRDDLSRIEPVIAHELTHAALAHLRLPKWLDEGLAVNTEHRVAGASRGLHSPHELHRMHARFWNTERIQAFWSGASFDRTDDGNLLSYELARIIVEQLARPWDRFARFVADARREDGGAASAEAHLSIRLGALVSTLLELPAASAWDPVPAATHARPAARSRSRPASAGA